MSFIHKFNLRQRNSNNLNEETEPVTQESSNTKTGAKKGAKKGAKNNPDHDSYLTRQGEDIDGYLSGNWEPQRTTEAQSRDELDASPDTGERPEPTDDNIPPTWELKIDTIIQTLRAQGARVAELESIVRNGASNNSNSRTNQLYLNRQTHHIDIDEIESTSSLIKELEEKIREQNKDIAAVEDTDLRVTKEELQAIDRLSSQPDELDFANPAASIGLRNITDPLARVIEKRRLSFVKNWSTVWPHLQLITNKPLLADRTWKKLAFGQYIELSEFLVQDISLRLIHEESELALTDGRTLSLNKDKRQPITNIALWIQAWERFTSAALIICAARREELRHHQRAVISHCNAFSFETVYLWDRAKRFFLAETRNKTLTTVDQDLDAKYLSPHKATGNHNSTSRTQKSGRDFSKNLCRLFNWRAQCDFGSICAYRHVCEKCGGDHPARTCDNRGGPFNKTRREEHAYATANKRPRKGAGPKDTNQ